MNLFTRKYTCPRCGTPQNEKMKKVSTEDGSTNICNLCSEYEVMINKKVATTEQELIQEAFRDRLKQ